MKPFPTEYEVDIRFWYANHKDACPNCGVNLGELHPAANLNTHFTRACMEAFPPGVVIRQTKLISGYRLVRYLLGFK